MRGFFGIGVYRPKNSTNLGTLLRSSKEFGASFIYTIEARCIHNVTSELVLQPSNTNKAHKHIPFFAFPTLKEFILPSDCQLVGVELTPNALDIREFYHPTRACYILGAEDDGLSDEVIGHCTGGLIHIPTPGPLNVAVAGSIIMYDRLIQQSGGRRRRQPLDETI